MIKNPNFVPLPLLSSFHLQMIAASVCPAGKEPESEERHIDIGNGDFLSCHISSSNEKASTIVLIHGLGGSYHSRYMIRISRKLFHAGYRVVRVNLRGCGTGKNLSSLPYNSGNSQDIKKLLESLQCSPLILIGFSLGGNIILKLAGELGKEKLFQHAIAVCPVLNLMNCVERIEHYPFYHNYYVNAILAQSQKWVKETQIRSIYEYDTKIIAPLWGYASAEDYYERCSSEKFIDQIATPCDILLAKDDPFIDYRRIYNRKLSPKTTIWLSDKGSHVGFIGQDPFFWLDQFLLTRIKATGLMPI